MLLRTVLLLRFAILLLAFSKLQHSNTASRALLPPHLDRARILLHIYFVFRVFPSFPNAHAHTAGGSLLVGIGVGAAVGWSGTHRRNLRFRFMSIQTTVAVLLVHVLR